VLLNPRPVTSKVADSSPVVPAKDFKDLAWGGDRPRICMLPYGCAHTKRSDLTGPVADAVTRTKAADARDCF
jgi:hypothetical protein